MSRRPASFALAAVLAFATSAGAAPLIHSYAQAQGRWDDGNPANDNLLVSAQTSHVAGSVAASVICVQSGQSVPGNCVFIPLPPGFPLGGYSAAEVFTEFGVSRVRNITVDPGGSQFYSSQAFSRWQDDFTYTGAAPGLVTFELTLDGSWQDGGRFNYDFGYLLPSIGFQGLQYTNCLEGELSGGCPDASTYAGVYLAGNDALNQDGTFNLTLRLSAIWNPLEQRTISSFLDVHSFGGAGVDAFNTARLTAIILEPGGSISSASGSSYQVLFAPEPGLSSLLGVALVAVTWAVRSRR